MALTFERSHDTAAAVIALRGVNGEISYVVLARHTGMTVERLKQVLPSAFRILEKENIVFGRIRGIAVKRLDGADKARSTESFKQRIRRAAKRGEKRCETVNQAEFGQLSSADQVMLSTNRTIFNVIKQQADVKRPAPKEAAKPPEVDVGKLVSLRKK